MTQEDVTTEDIIAILGWTRDDPRGPGPKLVIPGPWWCDGRLVWHAKPFWPTIDLMAAMTVVDHYRARFIPIRITTVNDLYHCQIGTGAAHASTLPLAICQAAKHYHKERV